MMRGSMAQAPMSQPASPTRLNRNAPLAVGVPRRRSEAMARMAPAPAHTPSMAATIGCGQARIALITSPVLRVNSSRSADDESLDGLLLGRSAEEIGQLRVALEGERVLLVGPVERDGRDLAVDRQPNMLRGVALERQGDRIGCAHRAPPLPMALRADALVLARRRRSVSMSAAESSANISPIQSPFS